MSQNPSDIGHLIIPHDKVPTSAYQAIYHKLTTKTERIRQIFPDAYEITAEDILQLDYRLCQTIKQYPTQGQNSTCAISLHKDEKITVSSMERFRISSFTSNKPTESVSYDLDFFTVLPVEIKDAENIVQRFKVSVAIDQDFMEESDDGIPYFIKGMTSGSNIIAAIEYSDYAVARSLQETIQEWVDSLSAKKIPKIIKFFERRADFANAYVPYAFSGASLVGLSRFKYSSDVSSIVPTILFCMSLSVFMYALGRFLNVQFYRQLSLTKPLTLISITNGDKARSSKLRSDKTTKAWVAGFFGVTIICGIFVNITSQYIIDWWRR